MSSLSPASFSFFPPVPLPTPLPPPSASPQDPDKFPPNPVVHAIEKFQRQRNIKHARQSIAQEVEYMRSHR